MKELVTRYIKINNSGLEIKILQLGELLNLIYLLDILCQKINADFQKSKDFFKTMNNVKKTLKRVIKKYTNVKDPGNKHLFIVELILNANLGTDSNSITTADRKSTIFSLIDLLASEYSWTEKYILENMTFEKAQKYAQEITMRKTQKFAQNTLGLCHAFHDPSGKFIKSLYSKVTYKQTKHYNNVKEYIKELKENYNA